MLTTKRVEEQVVMVLKTIYDPELPVNIYDLGLIYFVNVKMSEPGTGSLTPPKNWSKTRMIGWDDRQQRLLKAERR